jgi:hypothetical protein
VEGRIAVELLSCIRRSVHTNNVLVASRILVLLKLFHAACPVLIHFLGLIHSGCILDVLPLVLGEQVFLQIVCVLCHAVQMNILLLKNDNYVVLACYKLQLISQTQSNLSYPQSS